MIYDYEANILKHINKAVPDLRIMSYSKEPDLFNAMSSVKTFPIFFYYREPTDWNLPKVYKIVDNLTGNILKCFQINQKYFGKILAENQINIQNIAKNLKFFWDENPYLNFKFLDYEVDVELRLLSLKLEEERDPSNQKGSLRYVSVEWQSNLAILDSNINEFVRTNEINIYLDIESSNVKIYDGSNLIKILK